MEDECSGTRPLALFYAYELEEVETYSHANGFACVVFDMREKLRSFLKYNEEVNNNEELYKFVEKLQDDFYDMCNERHLPLN